MVLVSLSGINNSPSSRINIAAQQMISIFLFLDQFVSEPEK
jgi:hypothetical protein